MQEGTYLEIYQTSFQNSPEKRYAQHWFRASTIWEETKRSLWRRKTIRVKTSIPQKQMCIFQRHTIWENFNYISSPPFIVKDFHMSNVKINHIHLKQVSRFLSVTTCSCNNNKINNWCYSQLRLNCKTAKSN